MATKKTEEAVVEAQAAPAIIIEKYLKNRGDIAPAIQGALKTIYRGQKNTVAEWDGIINRRLSRPAE